MKRIRRRMLLIAAPFVAGFLLFYVLPLADSLRYSLLAGTVDRVFAGIRNYAAALQNPFFLLGLKNTFELLLMGVPVLIGIALAIAALLFGFREHVPSALQAALLLPVLTPSTAVAKVVGLLQAEQPRIPLLCVYWWKNAGLLTAVFLSAFSTIPQEVTDAAALDGAGKLRTLCRIILPMLRGTILFAAILAAALHMRLFREAFVLYGAYPGESVYLVQHYLNNHFAKLDYPGLTSAAMLFAAAALAVLGTGLALWKRVSGNQSGE